MAPPPPPHTNDPGQGGVYLDGTRVGHWMTGLLARAASRPHAGTTRFDARLSPTWPGAPVSN